MHTALTIAGSDCSGGAGIQADLKTMSALGVFGMSVIVSVVAENTARVLDVFDVPPPMITAQIEAVMEDIVPDAVKVGMLSSPQCMRTVADALRKFASRHVVIDPVMYAKNGCPLMHEDAVDTLIREVVPLATLLTPNIPEAEKITGDKIVTVQDMEKAAKKIAAMGARAVLVKGGHYMGDAQDVLYDGEKVHVFTTQRIATKNTHGTGCTLSSAIASLLARGEDTVSAVQKAKEYVTAAIQNALELGKGCGPTHHFHAFYDRDGNRK